MLLNGCFDLKDDQLELNVQKISDNRLFWSLVAWKQIFILFGSRLRIIQIMKVIVL